MPRRLIVFTRFPEPGKTKTRLIPILGAEGAAQLQREMTQHTMELATAAAKRLDAAVDIRYDGGDERQMSDWLGTELPIHTQGDGDLGARMARSFDDAFQAGDDAVVIIGTDCPGLTPELVGAAFDALDETDLVLGPANDGGYYLIGLRRSIPQLFVDIPWGTGEVREKTIVVARQLDLSVHLLEPLDDVDRPEDLPVWERVCRGDALNSEVDRISIVIPTLNEAGSIQATLKAARKGRNVETIVVDGGSTDDTVAIASSCGATVIRTASGRARQMNTGAATASGGVLLFLHADTRLPEGYDSHVRHTLAQADTVAGAFGLSFDRSSRGLRFLERAANYRSRRLQMPWGDQALFLRAEVFRELGGFPEMPIMEDFEFVRRLNKRGRVALVPASVLTSARRYEEVGPFRAWLTNRIAIWVYYLGVSPERIARWYRRRRKRIQEKT